MHGWRRTLMQMAADLGAAEPRSVMVNSPVFLVESVRSGTTLLRLTLDRHPEIAFDHEFE